MGRVSVLVLVCFNSAVTTLALNRVRIQVAEPHDLAINLPPVLLDTSQLRRVLYPKQFKGLCWSRPLRLERRLRGRARSTPRVQRGPYAFACELSGFFG